MTVPHMWGELIERRVAQCRYLRPRWKQNLTFVDALRPKQTAILEAATRIIVMQGLSAPTAGIAKEAGVANGSLFTYFETKTDLFTNSILSSKQRWHRVAAVPSLDTVCRASNLCVETIQPQP
jgi:hypothetical protein